MQSHIYDRISFCLILSLSHRHADSAEVSSFLPFGLGHLTYTCVLSSFFSLLYSSLQYILVLQQLSKKVLGDLRTYLKVNKSAVATPKIYFAFLNAPGLYPISTLALNPEPQARSLLVCYEHKMEAT